MQTRLLTLCLIAQVCCVALGKPESPNMMGAWNVEIVFADGARHSLHLDAQADGKGTLTVADQQSKVWGTATPSAAKWSAGEGNSVTFSGPVEFLLGNVGRDAGKLMCKGKFDTPDSIAGEVEFSPLVGDRSSKHGTFKAARASQ